MAKAEDIAADPGFAAPQPALFGAERAQEIAREEFGAVTGLMVVAGLAGTAAVEAEQHVIAGGEAGHVRPYRLDNACPFMPEHGGEGHR